MKFNILLLICIVLSTQLILAETLGEELITCNNFNCSDDWVIGSGFRIINTSNLSVFSSIYYPNISSLYQDISLTPNEQYKIVLDVKNTWFDWHNFWVELGGVNSSVYNSSGIKTFYLEPTQNQNLTLWVNRTYTESINANVIFNNISVKELFEALNISFGIGTEDSGSIIYTNNLYVNVSIAGSNFQNITYSLFNETSEINSTTFTSKIRTINWTDLNDGIYFYNVTLSNSTSSVYTETRNITIEASTNVAWCRELWKDNVVYTQTQDIDGLGWDSCIRISGTNVTFEGNGFEITNGGIYLSYASDSTINNTNSNKILVETASYCLIKNNLINNCTNECLKLGDNSADTTYNIFENNIFNNSNDTGIRFRGVSLFGMTQGASHNIFRNNQYLNIANYDVYMPTIAEFFVSQRNQNNTFLNDSYVTEYVSGANNYLTRKWYYQAKVNDSEGDNLENASVLVYDNTETLIHNLTTDSSGVIDIVGLAEYKNSAGVKTYYSNYSILAEKESYPNSRKYLNITIKHNFVDDFFTLDKCSAPSFGNWVLDCSLNCVVGVEEVPENMTIIGAGLTTVDSLTFVEDNWQIYKEDGCSLFLTGEIK